MAGLEDIYKEAMRHTEREMNEIYGIWKEIGLSSEKQQERLRTTWVHVHTLIQDIKNEEIALCEELKEKVKFLTEKVSILSRMLCMEPSQVAGLTYLQRLEWLEQEYNKFNDLRESRIKELSEMRIIEEHYCDLLGIEKYKFSSTTEIPSEDDLKGLKQHIDMLTDEHLKRSERYHQAKQQLSTIFEVTEITPESTLEKHICSDKEPLSLSKSTFQEIEEIINRANKRKEELEAKKNALVVKLNLLWDRLNIENSYRVEFMSNHLDCKMSTLLSLQNEVHKYDEMKKQNLSLFIDSVRKELSELWNKCGASESEKDLFFPFIDPNATEGVLIILEEEVERWKKYYGEVQFILEKIGKRNKLWELLKGHDRKANDPERFKNRGGNLLREEKERNKLLKTLPTIEQEIVQAIETYESKTLKKFFYLGEDYRSIISKQWGERITCKENMKHEKYFAPGKRSPFTTPKKSPAKFAIYRTPKSTKRVIQKRELDALKEVNSNLKENPTCSNAANYTDFERELNQTGRKSFRSSVVAARKIGGTRSPMPSKKRNSVAKNYSTLFEED